MNLKSMAAVAVASGVVTSVAAGDAVHWRVEDGGNGHWYRAIVSPIGISQESAGLIARELGGALAGLETAAENQWVASSFHGLVGLPTAQYWTSGSLSAGVWRWGNGDEIEFLPWNCGDCHPSCQPDYGCETGLVVMCMSNGTLFYNNSSAGCLGSGEHGVLVEWSSDCNSDGVVDYGQCRDGSLPDFNGNNIPDCCEEGTDCVVGQFPTQWKISEGGNGHWYRLNVGGPFTWTAARALAEARGGYLGTVTSAAEDRFIRDLIRVPAAFDLFVGPWLGGYQDVTAPDYSEPAGGWRWVTGEPWYAGWTGVEPNGGPLENLLHIAGTAPNFNDLNWNDFYEDFPTQPRSCVIEWSSDCNSDGIVDYGQILNGELADVNDNGVPDICEQTPCPGDIAADGVVNGVDLAAVLNNWGTTGGALGADANGDGVVDGADLALVLNSWGPCPK